MFWVDNVLCSTFHSINMMFNKKIVFIFYLIFVLRDKLQPFEIRRLKDHLNIISYSTQKNVLIEHETVNWLLNSYAYSRIKNFLLFLSRL